MKKDNVKKPTKKTDEVSSAQTWKERYQIAVNNQETMFKKFSDWYKLMYATVDDSNIALWRSKIFIPVLAGKAWNLIAKFVNLKPGFQVALRNPDASDEAVKEMADKMQLKLEYDYDNPNMDESIRDKMLSCLIDAVVTGTGLAKVPWHVKTKKQYERIIGDDGTVDLSKQKVTESKYGCNDLVPVNIFNVFIAPGATNLYKSPWIIIKEYKTLDQLKDMNKAEKIYKNLDKLENSRAEADQFAQYKKSRNRLTNDQDPIVTDKTVDYVAIYECYEGNKISTFADAGTKSGNPLPWVELRQQENPYWHGKYPLVRFIVKQRPYDVWGEGIFELTERLQSAVNDVFNHYMDNWNLSVDGMYMIPENSRVSNFVVQPGGQVTYQGTPPTQFKLPEPNPASVQNVLGVLEKAVEDATISSYATGATNSATDKTQGTATGIMKLQQAAGDIIAFMRSNFQQSMHQIGTMWLSNNQQYLDRAVTVPGKKGMNEEVHPAMLQGDMELRIDDASMEPVSREDQKASYLQFIQQTLALQNASIAQAQATQGQTKPLIIDFKEMFENISDKFGMKSSDDLLVDEKDMEQPPEQPGMQEEMPMQEGEDMGMPPMEQPPMEQMPMQQPPMEQQMPEQGMPQPPNGGMY
jgi:hypothetical protein